MRILILILLILIFIFEFNNLTHEIPTKKDVSSNDAQVLKAQSINKNNSNIEKKNKLLFETVENGQGLLIPSLDINDLLQNGVLKYLDVTGNKEHIIDNWKVVNNDISTSYLSSVEINDFNQPLTITVTDNELYMTLPLFSGVFSAESGLVNNIANNIKLFKRRKAMHEIKQHQLYPEELSTPTLRNNDKCLNC